jgi:hypothetical protein
MKSLCLLMLGAGHAAAGALDVDLGVQATKTTWPGDHGGGAALSTGYWFLPWLGASFIGKEQYATVDDRVLSYFSVNAAAAASIGNVRVVGTLGVVHQHEEPRAAIMEQPVASLFGVGDGIRHRMAGRAGVAVLVPIHAEFYAALDLDATRFMDTDKGPAWMLSAGASLGFHVDFAGGK